MAGRMSRFWEENLPRLKLLAEAGLTDKEIAEELGIPISRVTNTRTRYGIPGGEQFRDNRIAQYARRPDITRVVSETSERAVYQPEGTVDEPWEELWDRITRRTRREVERTLSEGLARVRIMTELPIAISLSSDWHISTSTSCDLPGLRAYAETIRDTPGAFAMAVGDLCDNNVKWSKNILDVPDEWRLVAGMLNIVGLKMLGIVEGNHDAWSKALAGINMLKLLAERERIHSAPDELTWLIELVDPVTHETSATYCVATRHRYRRNSNMNWTHACFRYLEERVGQWPMTEDGGELVPDIVAIADNHLATVEERDFANKPVWAARMGPWQVGSSYGRSKGFMRCPPTAPTFVLYPGRRKRIAGFADYGAALEFLRIERSADA